MKHNVLGLRWYQYQRGLVISVRPGTNGQCYRLERTIHAQSGNHYWEVWWCPSGWWKDEKSRVYLGRGRTARLTAIHAELHSVTQPDDYYARQLRESDWRASETTVVTERKSQ